MEQYEKSAPPVVPKSTVDEDHKTLLNLVKMYESDKIKTDQLISSLEKEIRIIKTKLDAHASVINRINNNPRG